MKKINIIVGIVLLALVAFFIKVGLTKSDDKEKKSKDKSERKVDAYILSPSLLTSEISVTGSLVAYDEVDLKNEVSGRVVFINLPEGKYVAKGTLLVKLFDDDLQATLRKLESQLAIQQKIYNRQTQLVKVNGLSENDYDQTLLELNTLKADIAEEKALIRKTEVRAPFNGTIGLRKISIGDVVSSSTSLATIRTDQKLKLDFYVPEKYSYVISMGMNVDFTMYENGSPFTAKVIATEHGIEDATRNLKVRALVTSNSKELVPGAYANVTLMLGENSQALMVPTQSIIPDQENKKVIVAKNGKAHFVNIKTGVRKASKVEVVEGLAAGDTIMTSGLLFLKEDSKLSYLSVTK